MKSEVFERVRATLPGYDIGEEIARGGFGVVLFGTHQRLQRKVAIKVLTSDIASDEDMRRRFAAEARLMAGIDHPHVVPVYDYVEDGELCLFVMEYLPAGTVLKRLTSKGFQPGSAIGVALACASALESAHRQGVLHRDVKPANLMFAANGTVKLSDFGIAKIVGGDGAVTRAGDVLGTAYYIAPEQVLGQPVSPATDIYALATTLYQLLSGTLPFPTDVDSTALYLLHAYSSPIPLSKVAPNVPSQIADVVMGGLTTDPHLRWGSAEEFGVALASATTRCWGPNWLAQAGVPVLGNESITAATAAISSPAVGRTDKYTSALPSTPPVPATREVPSRPSLPSLPPPSSSPSPATLPPPAAPPQLSRREVAAATGEPPSARVPYLIAGVLAVAAIIVAFVGLGSPSRGGDLAPGAVTIVGADPVTAEDVQIDMAKPIDVTVVGVQGDTVSLTRSVLGIPIGTHEAPLEIVGSAGVARVDGFNPYVISGVTSAELRISDGDKTTASYRFGMRSTQSAAMTAFTGGVVLIALFALAYVESFTRTLRRGRIGLSQRIGLQIAAAILSVAMVAGVWIAVGREPTPTTVVVCALIGVAAGVSGTIAAIRRGALNRWRRMNHSGRSTGYGGATSARTGGLPSGPLPPYASGPADGDTSAARWKTRGLNTRRD